MYYNILHLLIVVKSDFTISIQPKHIAPLMAKNRTITGAIARQRAIGLHLIIYTRAREGSN